MLTSAKDLKELKQLVLYPIKGCGGITLPAVSITPLGVASPSGIIRDRAFMIVKAEGKPFVTQRQKPALALVRTRIEPAEALLEGSTIPAEDITLVVSAQDMPEDLRIPIVVNASTTKPSIDVTVWGWSGAALEESPEAAAWFTKYLGVPSKLVRYAGSAAAKPAIASSFERHVDPEWTSDPHPVAFADGFPYLVANEASLEDLNTRLKAENQQEEEIFMNRFRPNIIIGGESATPWEEDHWQEVKFLSNKSRTTEESTSDTAILRNVKPCSRCKVPTINQETGVVGEQPAKIMYKFRSGNFLGWTQPSSFKASVFFGSNMCCIKGAGTVVRVRESKMEVVSLLKEPLSGGNDYGRA
jgi:uncharacterized protein